MILSFLEIKGNKIMNLISSVLTSYLCLVMMNVVFIIMANHSFISFSKKMADKRSSVYLENQKTEIKRALNPLLTFEFVCYLPLTVLFFIHKDYRIPKTIYGKISEKGLVPPDKEINSIENEDFKRLVESIIQWKKENGIPLEKPVEGDFKVLYNMVFENEITSYKEILK